MHESNPGWLWKTERSVPSQPRAVRGVVREVVGQLRTHGWPRDEIFGVHLALEEGLVNAVRHGNRSDSHKRVHFRCSLSGERIWIEIEDEGVGFDPHCLPDPTAPENLCRDGGRGVMLMRAYMSRVEFNAVGNCVTMEKLRAGRAAS